MPVFDSDAILRTNYDPDSRTLFVVFRTLETYAYFEVPPEVYEAFLKAESAGRFFAQHVRGRYDHHHVT